MELWDSTIQITLVLLLYVLMGVLCSSIAKRKGHSPTNGFLGGCIFGTLGLVYWIAISDKSKDEQAQKLFWQQKEFLNELEVKKIMLQKQISELENKRDSLEVQQNTQSNSDSLD